MHAYYHLTTLPRMYLQIAHQTSPSNREVSLPYEGNEYTSTQAFAMSHVLETDSSTPT